MVPSRQRSEAVRLSYAAAALAREQSVWPTPDVLPLDAWKAREIERRAAAGEPLPRLLTPAEEWFLWRQSSSLHTASLELVARGPLTDALLRAGQLAQEFGIDLSRLRGAPGDEARLLSDVQQSVAERCSALGAATAAQLASRLPCLGGERPLVLAGFGKVTPSLTALAASRAERSCITRMRAPLDNAQNITRTVLATDPLEELERIAEWCRLRLDAQPDARLLVLFPGAAEARERLVTLIRQNVDARGALHADLAQAEATELAALDGGAPLARAPLVAHALQALSWLTKGSEFADFSAWLCAPYWDMADAPRARLDIWLRERATLEINPRALLAALERAGDSLPISTGAIATQVADALRELGAGQASPRQWSERFLATLAALGWPGRRSLNSDEEQTRARFTELLDSFGQLAAAAGSISRDTAVQWLTELATRTSFRPASGDALVTVSARLADPVVQYDGIWVAGLHADAWPQPAQPDPFLPLAAQLAAGVPAASPAGRAEEARVLMAAWRSATPHLVLSAPLRSGDVQLSPSPMLAHGAAKPGADSRTIWLPLRLRRDGLTEFVDDCAGVPWDARPLPSGTRSVELQNLCPFRAYAELRLGSAPLDAPEPGVAADVRGQLLHGALEKIWRVLGGSEGLQARSDGSLDALIADCVDEAATEAMDPRGQPLRREERSALEQRECRRAVRLIRALCDLERRREPFKVKETELPLTLRLAGAQLRLRIDRLDELASGGLAILDYKSGRHVAGDWYSVRPSHPQLLAYLAAVGEEAVAMATVNVTAREVRFDGVAADPDLLPRVRAVATQPGEDTGTAWTQRQREWHARVEQLASDFLTGRAVADPRPKACEYCQVVSVCRISDIGPGAVEQNIDE